MLVLSIFAMESARSTRFLYKHFLPGIKEKTLNTFYYAYPYSKVDYSKFMNMTTAMTLELIPEHLKPQPVFHCIDGTRAAKSGKQFKNVSKLFDHSIHNGCSYLNGHCFVSPMLCVPVWQVHQVSYLAVPPWLPHVEERGIKAGASSIHSTAGHAQKSVIILYSSWYAKKDLLCVVDKYAGPDVVCNARYDSVIYDLAPQPTGRKGKIPAAIFPNFPRESFLSPKRICTTQSRKCHSHLLRNFDIQAVPP